MSTTSVHTEALKKRPSAMTLSGPEKAAILILCMGEERGSALMQRLDEADIHTITRAISGIGAIHAEVAEQVMADFIETAAMIRPSTMETAKSLLASFLPQEKVEAIMKDIGTNSGKGESALWQEIANVDEKTIAEYLEGEQDQTIAVIAANLPSPVAARVLPLLGQDRMMAVLERMLDLSEVPEHVLDEIEASLRSDILAANVDPSELPGVQRMAKLFDSFDETLFESVSAHLGERAPEEFEAIRSQMFTFNDLIRIEGQDLARVMRGVSGSAVPLALKGAKEEVRDHFLSALPGRSRDMLVEEMAAMGPVRARDVRDAQAALVDCAKQLLAQDVIQLPMDAEDDTEEYID
ncbi:MAG: FliG C-terminal domain-containing protein [Pseudomonadota bacterium]